MVVEVSEAVAVEELVSDTVVLLEVESITVVLAVDETVVGMVSDPYVLKQKSSFGTTLPNSIPSPPGYASPPPPFAQ